MSTPDTTRLLAQLRAVLDLTHTEIWLTTVLAEEALGGPGALRRTPLQAAAGTTVRLFNVPVSWSARGLDRAVDTVRATPLAFSGLVSRGAHAGDVAVKTLAATRDAALETAEKVAGREDAAGPAPPSCCIRPAPLLESSNPASGPSKISTAWTSPRRRR
ncbi:hypothetical protein HGB39_25675 [Rhodococcus opacus]|nr:hypothetical protein [Rhodococcus opacus]